MAKAIIDALINKKWSQLQLAHNSNIDIKYINEIERGGCLYDDNIFNKLSKVLGVIIERNIDII
jgi:ribosome-binding protein aMBF1 (putative translation factor)